MTRVLVIDEALPHPPDSGKRIRTFELISRLARSFDVTLAYHDDGTTSPEAVEAVRDARIEPLPVARRPLTKRGVGFAWDLFRNLFLSVPYMVMAHRTRALRQAILRAHARTPFELVHVEWTPLVANVPPSLAVPVCIAAHNVESDIWRRYLENEAGFARRRYIARQLAKVERFERGALHAADAVTAVSEHDAERIRSWAGQPSVTVVSNGVNAAYFAPAPSVAVDPDEVLFVGSLDWRPNLDAIEWCLDEILPALRARRPGAKLTVVGRNPPAWLEERVGGVPGVTIHGSVPDVRPYMARAAVHAVPLRIGGGSRLKICEALSMQRPVVATTVGAEGLDIDEGIVRADGAGPFAMALADALANPGAARARALAGHQRVMESYEWGRIAPRQADVWSSLSGRSVS